MTQSISPARRWYFAIGVSVLAFALAGCLKFPLGDPETATVDPALAGSWFKRADDGAVTIWHAQVYDARTYLVMQYQAKPDGNAGWERGSMTICKMWLTTVKGKSFGCLQVLSEQSDKPYVAFKYERSGESITIQGISGDYVDKAGVANAADFVALVDAHVDDEAMYLDADKYEKTGDADKETVDAILKAFH